MIRNKKKSIKSINLVVCRITDYTKYILPISCFDEEKRFIETMYCPVCKTKSKCHLLEKNKKVENSYVYDIVTAYCNVCKSQLKLKFFVYTERFNRRNIVCKEYFNFFIKRLLIWFSIFHRRDTNRKEFRQYFL